MQIGTTFNIVRVLNVGAFASTRSVQIATLCRNGGEYAMLLCLHTLRADCNGAGNGFNFFSRPLPPHAPCRLQLGRHQQSIQRVSLPPHAPCRLQPKVVGGHAERFGLCLHTLRADCNLGRLETSLGTALCLHTLRADCNCRNAQNCNIHFFRTCVESVDSFSVLNKAMLC